MTSSHLRAQNGLESEMQNADIQVATYVLKKKTVLLKSGTTNGRWQRRRGIFHQDADVL